MAEPSLATAAIFSSSAASGSKAGSVKALFFDGLPWKGKPTRVFAYYGIPSNEGGGKVPAIVLVHGGGGTAFARWVKLWNDRGYAAIAMDTCGAVGGAGDFLDVVAIRSVVWKLGKQEVRIAGHGHLAQPRLAGVDEYLVGVGITAGIQHLRRDALDRQLVAGQRVDPAIVGEQRQIGGAKVSFHPAGHVPGSAQIRVEDLLHEPLPVGGHDARDLHVRL